MTPPLYALANSTTPNGVYAYSSSNVFPQSSYNATTYTFRVSATNASGTGAASAASNPATPQAVPPACPCTIFGSSTPSVVDSGDGASVVLGVAFDSDTSGYIAGIRFYKAAANTGTHVGT